MTDDEIDRDPFEAVAAEFVARQRRGEHPSVTEYVARYPEVAEELHELLPTIAAMERLKTQREQTSRMRASLGSVKLERLGEFRIVREIGRGGMGIVFEAEQESLRRRVAIKVLPRHALINAEHLTRFEREAQIAAQLHHPNIVSVFGVGEHDGYHYYVMQLVSGIGLDKIITRMAEEAGERSPLPPIGDTLPYHIGDTGGKNLGYWKTVAGMGLQVARALHYAHSQGTLHCDIKPANLLLDAEGVVRVTDFGVAKAMQFDRVTQTGDVTGTLQYIAPERFRGQTDARSDVYSLGLTLYELLTLRSALGEGSRHELFRRIMDGSPAPPRQINPQIPRDLETIVLKAIAHDPASRYASAGALAEDLERYVADLPIQARRTGFVERGWRWCRRNRTIAALSAAVVGLTALIVVLATVHRGRDLRRLDQVPVDGVRHETVPDWNFRPPREGVRPMDRGPDDLGPGMGLGGPPPGLHDRRPPRGPEGRDMRPDRPRKPGGEWDDLDRPPGPPLGRPPFGRGFPPPRERENPPREDDPNGF
jgi:serine/threonine protein kinase